MRLTKTCRRCKTAPIDSRLLLCLKCRDALGTGRAAQLKRRHYEKPCMECGKSPCRKRGGLCMRCRRDPELAASHPDRRHEPTMEELERTIAEQMQCLPSWWAKDVERPQRVEIKVFRLGRGVMKRLEAS